MRPVGYEILFRKLATLRTQFSLPEQQAAGVPSRRAVWLIGECLVVGRQCEGAVVVVARAGGRLVRSVAVGQQWVDCAVFVVVWQRVRAIDVLALWTSGRDVVVVVEVQCRRRRLIKLLILNTAAVRLPLTDRLFTLDTLLHATPRDTTTRY